MLLTLSVLNCYMLSMVFCMSYPMSYHALSKAKCLQNHVLSKAKCLHHTGTGTHYGLYVYGSTRVHTSCYESPGLIFLAPTPTLTNEPGESP